MKKIYDALISAHRLLWSDICLWLIDNLSNWELMSLRYQSFKQETYERILHKHAILMDPRIVHDFENCCFLCDYARTKMKYDNEDDSEKRHCAFCPSVYSTEADPGKCLSGLYAKFNDLAFNVHDAHEDMRIIGIKQAKVIRDTPIKSNFKPAGIDVSYLYDEALKQMLNEK